MKKVTLVGVDGSHYVCHSHEELAKFILFRVYTGQIQIRSKIPKLRKRNQKVMKLISIYNNHFKGI